VIDRDSFFDLVRTNLFGNRLSDSQKEGMASILEEWESRKLTDLRMLAYMLATSKWETAHTMRPVRETLATNDLDARRRLNGVWYAGTDSVTGQSYYGRGFVQLTHKRNYAVMTKLLGQRFGVDLVKNPDLALRPDIATAILFEGMLKGDSHVGDFTGLALEDFFNDRQSDWIGARKIINGTDHDRDIAEIAMRFYAVLKTGKDDPSPMARPLLMYGMQGEDVKELQEQLKAHHCYKSEIDGDFGPLTRDAVIEFQSMNDLVEDGIVGELTRKELEP